MRSKIRSEQKEKLNSNEMMTKLATLWKELPENEKKHYFDTAEKEKVRYLLELNDFYQNYPYEVIQNKTKKNHVKKPCSAYALYLQEQKKLIKVNSPNLKMADILKLVGERWKSLSESEKSVYQQKAQAEKEVTKAKLNEHMLRDIEELKKAPIPQKRVQSHKRIQKALLKENAKLDPYFRDHIIQESMRARGEPMIRKQQMTSSYPQRQNMSEFDFNNFSTMFNINGERADQNSMFQSRLGSTTDPNLNKEASFLLNLCETTTKIAKRSSDLIFDLIKFQSKNEENPAGSESTVYNSSTGAVGERVNANLSSRAQAMNETLINCLNFENSDFNFESLDVKHLISSLKCIERG
jgi:hypothetical protein